MSKHLQGKSGCTSQIPNWESRFTRWKNISEQTARMVAAVNGWKSERTDRREIQQDTYRQIFLHGAAPVTAAKPSVIH